MKARSCLYPSPASADHRITAVILFKIYKLNEISQFLCLSSCKHRIGAASIKSSGYVFASPNRSSSSSFLPKLKIFPSVITKNTDQRDFTRARPFLCSAKKRSKKKRTVFRVPFFAFVIVATTFPSPPHHARQAQYV